MILSIGLDTIEIQRFKNWHKFNTTQLKKIYQAEEIEYCLENQTKSAERLAIRFAAKEAAYKAINSLLKERISFFKFCKVVKITRNKNSEPLLIIDWKKLNLNFDSKKILIKISLTHSKTIATAIVLFEYLA